MYDGFSDWKDVQSNFSMNEPEPDEVLLAFYDTPSYEGYALVIYRNGDTYYSVSGSHCSCYGLEGQWEPTDYTKDVLAGLVERMIAGCYDVSKDTKKQYLDHVMSALNGR